jgi:hypothetical protein
VRDDIGKRVLVAPVILLYLAASEGHELTAPHSAPNGKKTLTAQNGFARMIPAMKLLFRINDRLERITGFVCRALPKALCGSARLRRGAAGKDWLFPWARFGGTMAIAAGILIGLAGCQTQPGFSELSDMPVAVADPLVLREGDTVRISFPGSPNLNAVQQIRRDGKVSLPLVGEFQAAGLTPVQMEKEPIKLYEPPVHLVLIRGSGTSGAFSFKHGVP